jgi:hypothetical protein
MRATSVLAETDRSRKRRCGHPRIIGHVFEEHDGSLGFTPTVAASEADILRLKAIALGLGRWKPVHDRLLAGMSGRERGR